MTENTPPDVPLFPEFERFVMERDLLNQLRSGALGPKIHRVMGQGKTKADGLDLPPAPIERKRELISLNLPAEVCVPDPVESEIKQTKSEVEVLLQELSKPDGVRRLASQVLRKLETEGVPTGYRDNCFFADRLILVSKKGGESWAWSLTSHYPIVEKMPPDPQYLKYGFDAARKRLKDLVMPPEEFEMRLGLAWKMAKHFGGEGEVFMVDVARLFKVAGQPEAFWRTPKRMFFRDLPDASFVANLLSWRQRGSPKTTRFEFVPATLHQAHGPRARVFFMPANDEGTITTPIVYLRKLE